MLVGVMKKYGEFVAAKSADQMVRADNASDTIRQRFEHTVTHRMTKLVIDRFEMIQIDLEKGKRMLLCTAFVHGFKESSPAQATRQIVMHRQIADAILGFPLLCNIRSNTTKPQEAAIPAMHRISRKFQMLFNVPLTQDDGQILECPSLTNMVINIRLC
ncbi:hypothetical protein NBRC3255_2953 [Gluconobacter thailandicus NBRC 3255]|nr:hypothetical protein NBRC3255_2953 [Gluconobacter thailandicus NBRC 3255]